MNRQSILRTLGGVAILGIIASTTAVASAQIYVQPGPTPGGIIVQNPPLIERIYIPPQTVSSTNNLFSPILVRPSSPIFMTSINYPGVYGAYYYGVAPEPYLPGVTQSEMTLAPTLPLPSTIPPLERLSRPERMGASATINIHVPEGGLVWVQDQALPQNATNEYTYTTPALRPNQLYTYEVRAAWTEEGQPITNSRLVKLQSGEKHLIEFTRRTPAPSTLRAIVPQQ